MEGPSSKAVSKDISFLLESAKANNGIELNTLPTELLIDIFSIFLLSKWDTEEKLKDRYIPKHPVMGAGVKRLQRLASVCSRWWHIVKSTPHLWVNVDANNGSLVKLQVRRASNLPLAITFNPQGYLSGEEFMDVVGERRHHWRSLELCANLQDWEKISPFLVEPMALLEKATLTGHKDDSNIGDELPLPFGGGPQLHSLHLINIYLDTPTTHAFGSLVELCISRLTGEWGEGYFWKLLLHCRSLKVLRVTEIESSGLQPLDSSGPIIPVSLPCLETLEVSKDDHVCPRLLLGLHAEKLRWLRVKDDMCEGGGLDNLVLPQDYPTPLQSILNNVIFHDIRIAYSSVNRMIEIDGATSKEEADQRIPSDDMEFPRYRPSMTLDLRLRQDIGGLNSLRYINFGSFPVLIELHNETDPSFLQFLPGIISLSLFSHSNHNWEGAQKYTTFLSDIDHDTRRCHCPRLGKLFIDSSVPDSGSDEYRTIVDGLLRMLQIRRMCSGDSPTIEVVAPDAEFDPVNGRFIMMEYPGMV